MGIIIIMFLTCLRTPQQPCQESVTAKVKQARELCCITLITLIAFFLLAIKHSNQLIEVMKFSHKTSVYVIKLQISLSPMYLHRGPNCILCPTPSVLYRSENSYATQISAGHISTCHQVAILPLQRKQLCNDTQFTVYVCKCDCIRNTCMCLYVMLMNMCIKTCIQSVNFALHES